MAIDFATGNFLGNFGDDRGGISVQRREYVLQVVGATLEGLPIGPGMDRARDIAREGGDEFDVRRLHRTCVLGRPSARHQLANGRSNTVSLGHGLPPWLGLGPVARWLPCRRPGLFRSSVYV